MAVKIMAKASELLEIARKQLGVREAPPGSNNVRYNTWYYGREVSGASYPWCMVFVQWVFDQAGVKLPVRTASCGRMMDDAKRAGNWVTKDFRPGDVLIFNFPGGAATDHCGILKEIRNGKALTFEGNTGSTSDADGGQVQLRERDLKYIVGAVRPVYDREEEEDMPRYNTVQECPEWARATIQKLVDRKILSGTGEGLDLSHDMVRMLVIQDRAGLFDRG